MMYKVALDPGHGGKDNGAVKYLVEDAVNLVEALACRDFLQAYGCFDIWMSRTKDTATDLNATCSFINKWKADIAVSIHNNAGGGDGFEVFYSKGSTKGWKLAKAIESRVKATGQQSRGLKTKLNSRGTDFFGFNRLPVCPSIITEGCFVDNKKDAAGYDTAAEQREYGYAVARGILDYFGVKEIPSYRLNYDMNLRETRSTSSDILGVVPKGEVVAGTLLLDGWLQVTYKGKTGYIRVHGAKKYGTRI